MNKKKFICVLGVIVFAVLVNVYVFRAANQKAGDMVLFCVELSASQEEATRIFPDSQVRKKE